MIAGFRRSQKRIKKDDVRIEQEESVANASCLGGRFRRNSFQQMQDTCSPLSVFSVSRVFEKAAPPSIRSRETSLQNGRQKAGRQIEREREEERMQKSDEKQHINLIASEKQNESATASMLAFVFDREGSVRSSTRRLRNI